MCKIQSVFSITDRIPQLINTDINRAADVLVRFKETSQTAAEILSYKQIQLKEQIKGETDERMRREGEKTKRTTQ